MSNYQPIIPFFIDTEGYTDRDMLMFVCGVEYQMVYKTIEDKDDWNQCIHTENENRVQMLCAKLRVPVMMRRCDDTWTYCEIPGSTLL